MRDKSEATVFWELRQEANNFTTVWEVRQQDKQLGEVKFIALAFLIFHIGVLIPVSLVVMEIWETICKTPDIFQDTYKEGLPDKVQNTQLLDYLNNICVRVYDSLICIDHIYTKKKVTCLVEIHIQLDVPFCFC